MVKMSQACIHSDIFLLIFTSQQKLSTRRPTSSKLRLWYLACGALRFSLPSTPSVANCSPHAAMQSGQNFKPGLVQHSACFSKPVVPGCYVSSIWLSGCEWFRPTRVYACVCMCVCVSKEHSIEINWPCRKVPWKRFTSHPKRLLQFWQCSNFVQRNLNYWQKYLY